MNVMDRLTSMAIFIRAVDLGSLAEAARATGISAGMAGKHLRATEKRLGVSLLNRTTRRLSLTDAGRMYYERCQQILAEIEEAERDAINQQTLPRGVLRVNAPIGFGELHLAPAVAEFNTNYPDVSVEIIVSNHFVDLMDGSSDLAIRVGRLPDSGLIARRLAPCHRVVCAAPRYLERRGAPTVPDELKQHNCLIYLLEAEPKDWRLTGPQGEQIVRVEGSLHSNSGFLLREAGLAGLGVLRLPSYIVGEDLNAGRLLPLLKDYVEHDLGIYAVFLQSRQLAAKVRAFVEFLSRRFGPEPYWDEWTRSV
jgi:DNA-binding transcriptional LysR family regulator